MLEETAHSSHRWRFRRATHWISNGQDKLTALADHGYHMGDELLKCEMEGATAIVPCTTTPNNNAKGQFDKRDFISNPEDDQ